MAYKNQTFTIKTWYHDDTGLPPVEAAFTNFSEAVHEWWNTVDHKYQFKAARLSCEGREIASFGVIEGL